MTGFGRAASAFADTARRGDVDGDPGEIDMWMHPWALGLLAVVAAVAAATWWRPIRGATVVASVHVWRDVVAAGGAGRSRRLRPPPAAWWLLLSGSVAAVVAVAGPVKKTTPPPVAPLVAAPALMSFDAVEAVTVADGSDQLFVALRSHAAFGRAVAVTVLIEPTGAVLSAGVLLPPGGRVVRVFDVPASATALHVLAGDGALSATLTRRRSSDAAMVGYGRDNPFIRRLMRTMAARSVPADPDAASFAVAVGADLAVAPPVVAGALAPPDVLSALGVDIRHARPWVGAPEPPAACAVAPAESLRMLLAEPPGRLVIDDAPWAPAADVPPPSAAAFAWVTPAAGRAAWYGELPSPPAARTVAPAAPAPPPEARWEAPAILAGLFWVAGWRRLGRVL